MTGALSRHVEAGSIPVITAKIISSGLPSSRIPAMRREMRYRNPSHWASLYATCLIERFSHTEGRRQP